VVDLLEVLDGPDREAPADIDMLARMRTPGAVELLAAYEQMNSESRAALVGLLRSLSGLAEPRPKPRVVA
jgi:hypothetical protein